MFAGFYSDLHGRRKPSFGQFCVEVTCPCQPLSFSHLLHAFCLSACHPRSYVPVTLTENGILEDLEAESKAVPLHAMEALGGRRVIAPTHS
jgi:hypothetical protein